MNLEFFSRQMVKALTDSADKNLTKYAGPNTWLAASAPHADYCHPTGIEVDSLPALQIPGSGNDNKDALNARILHAALGDKLTPVQATDGRLWAWMCHTKYWDYMAVRWPAASSNALVSRYLMKGHSFGALIRNGVSRLWWGAHLTYDASRSDPFELTDVLFSLQDIQLHFTDRAIGKSRPLLHAALDYIKEHNVRLSHSEFGRRVQILARELNLAGGVSLLDALPRSDIYGVLNSISASWVLPEAT